MKRIAIALALATGLAAFLVAGTATADNNGPSACGGKQIVNVVYKMVNDYDSNTHGGAWANDSITRHLKVFDLGDGTYCATVNDTGSFVTMAADSPNGTGTVPDGITGQINGGYVTNAFAATLSGSPAYKTHGNLGTFDLMCASAYDCPGARPSFLSYFDGSPSWGFADWGWTYHTAKNGAWVNAASGNSGDITG